MSACSGVAGAPGGLLRTARRRLRLTGLLLAAASLPVSVAHAQLPTYDVGRAPTAGEIAAWDLTIPPDGEGLPPGSGTAALGKRIYVERCAA